MQTSFPFGAFVPGNDSGWESVYFLMRSSLTGRHTLFAVVFCLLMPLAPLLAQTAATPQPVDTLRLSLAQAVTMAQRQSDEVGVADAQVSVADALYGAARANMLPQLRFSGAYLHTFESARGQAVGAQFNQPNTYTGNLNLSQTLFQGGRLRSATRAADDQRQAARFDATETTALITVQVQRAYLQALFADRLVQLQERNLALATSRVTQVEQFEKAGRAARYDVLRARVERSNIEPQVIQSRSDRDLALLDLKRLLNLPVTQPLALSTQVDPSVAAARLADLVDTAMVAERAAVRSAELNLAARRMGVSVARADYFPTFTAFFQSGYQAFPPAGQGFPTSRGHSARSSAPLDPPRPDARTAASSPIGRRVSMCRCRCSMASA